MIYIPKILISLFILLAAVIVSCSIALALMGREERSNGKDQKQKDKLLRK
ncbi:MULTISPECIES: hypothetical protein [Bacillaceae]|nr:MULTISPECIES: hypothetical protein [Bacillaceae]